MAHDIFISHSSKDKPIADAICASLEAAGIGCWIAPRNIAPGEDFPTAIAKGIAQSRAMVLLFSANANSSQEISRELFIASRYKLATIGFKIEDVVLSEDKICPRGRALDRCEQAADAEAGAGAD